MISTDAFTRSETTSARRPRFSCHVIDPARIWCGDREDGQPEEWCRVVHSQVAKSAGLSKRKPIKTRLESASMGHCPQCGETVEQTVTGNTDTDEGATMRYAYVHECPHCGVILGVSDSGM